jgi:hypothetical protein
MKVSYPINVQSLPPLHPLPLQSKKHPFYDVIAPFAIGGFSGSIATCLIQPIDTFKVQIQVTSEKLGKALKHPSFL